MSTEPTERDVAEVLMDVIQDGNPRVYRVMPQLAARRIIAAGWVSPAEHAERIADARREGAADELDRRADNMNPGDHHCFKPWCPHCAVRKGMEREREALRKRAAALRGDA